MGYFADTLSFTACGRKTLICALFMLAFIIGLPAPAVAQTDSTAIEQVLQSAKRGRWSDAAAQAARSRDPLAQRLYQWLYFTRNDGSVKFEEVTAFMRANPDWPRQGTLRLAAEGALPANLPDAAVIAWFTDYPPRTQSGMERYLDALARQGREAELKQNLSRWWRNSNLTADQQSRLLSRYGQHLTVTDHLARLDAQIKNRQYTNARAIGRRLGRGYPDLVEARIALAESQPGVDRLVQAVPPHLQGDPGFIYDRLRWRRRNGQDVGALNILHNPPPADQIPNLADWWVERHIMTRRLIERKQYDAAYSLVAKHQQTEGLPFAQAEFLAGWLALKTNQAWKAFEHFESLYHGTSTPISRSRGAYWAGRASDALGHPDIAKRWYQVAARHQTAFYGQTALAALDDQYKPPQQLPPVRSVSGQHRFNNMDMVRSARAFHRAGMRRETSDFLNALADSVSEPEDFLYVAELSQDLDHLHNAVRAARVALQKDVVLMDHAFPSILQRMRNVDSEWALVHSLIRQESGFDYDALSSAGARGLMQLMPATAREVASRLGVPHRNEWLTERPDHNILLGSTYLNQMIRRYDGSYAIALAAYNAGPGRADRWLREIGDPRKGEIDIIDWIELLPIYETRNYVQRVLESVYVYRIKLNDVQRSFNAPIHVATSR